MCVVVACVSLSNVVVLLSLLLSVVGDVCYC